MKTLITQDFAAVAEVELSYKSQIKPSKRPKVTGSLDAYKILIMLWNEDTIELQEQFKVLLLNRANKVIGCYSLASRGTAGVPADAKLIFTAALKANACGIVLARNHPSGYL